MEAVETERETPMATEPMPSESESDSASAASAALARTLAEYGARLERLERAVDELRATASVNGELARRNVALSLAAGGGARAPSAPAAHTASGERSVTVRVGDDSVAVLGNRCTYEMRDDLKRAGAQWASDAPARWVLPRAAWDQFAAQWADAFGVTFVPAPG
jgi:hypothetical protein